MDPGSLGNDRATAMTFAAQSPTHRLIYAESWNVTVGWYSVRQPISLVRTHRTISLDTFSELLE